jgi:hypothetical protein
MSNNANNSAFPSPQSAINQDADGLTKREYIATQIAAAVSGTGPGWPSHEGDEKWIAQYAVKAADALLAELAK